MASGVPLPRSTFDRDRHEGADPSVIASTFERMPASALAVTEPHLSRDPSVGCAFCGRLRPSKALPDIAWWPVAESRDFLAVPSVGALVPGWLLLMPKRHVLSLALLSPQERACLLEDVAELRASWGQLFGPLTLFEHGPAEVASPVGCSIDHAHLHLVPTGNIDLYTAAQRHLPELTWAVTPGLANLDRLAEAGKPYLYLETPDGTSRVATGPEIPSQALRRAYAAELGEVDRYDWKAFPRLEVVQETVSNARAAGVAAA